MLKKYHRPIGIDGKPLNIVYYEENNKRVSIPFDPANKDYQEYLEWVAKGNQPEEANEA